MYDAVWDPYPCTQPSTHIHTHLILFSGAAPFQKLDSPHLKYVKMYTLQPLRWAADGCNAHKYANMKILQYAHQDNMVLYVTLTNLLSMKQ